MSVRRTATRLCRGPSAAPADPGYLAALRDQAASRVPDLGFLVEPAAADPPGPGSHPEQSGSAKRSSGWMP